MQIFTVAQVERAIGYWRKHYAQARFNPADALEEQLLTALYRRMLAHRMGCIGADQLSPTELIAFRCLNDIIWASREDL
ncbi:DUF3717 domain-containing protein [Paraburkholderia sp. IW21]|uniref:DUF3717 domain-containing protein n=1 Tax=Paraburkholderia sp. IW21 TaxID=3242488 RepID=UPI00351FA106